MTMKTSFLLLVLMLGACAGSARNDVAAVYDFGLPSPVVAPDGGWPKLALEVRSPPWLDASAIDYRLAYDDPLKRRHYVDSRWAGAPAGLIANRLRQQLGAADGNGNVAADCLLRVELQEFSQVFDSPQASRALLQGRASLIDGKRRPVAEREVSIEMTAATPDAPGGVKALVLAGNELGLQLAGWMDGLKKSKGLPACNR